MSHWPPERRYGNNVPRAAHGEWKRGDHRVDPLAILDRGGAGRLPDLVPIRYGRMLASPFAFYRGSAAVMAADLAKTPATGIRVQACGDCHLANFGGFATPERNIIFDINDFDETSPAPWEWDVKRLAASLASRSALPRLQRCARPSEAVSTAARSYRKTIREFSRMHPLDVGYARVTADDFLKVAKKDRSAVRESDRSRNHARRRGRRFPETGRHGRWSRRHPRCSPLIFHPEQARAAEFQA